MTQADDAPVSGRAPRATPASVDELCTLLASTPTTDRYRIVGRGTWPGLAERVRATSTLDLSALDGIVDYVPGDLTLTALGGTPLSTIAARTAHEGQFLPLDPWGDPDGTLGATLATASTGPLATSFGHPRDVVLGIEVVDAQGTRTRAGGRVVKNVAGFDLARLQTGAWGTLGILTEATVRLRALPEADVTLAIPAPVAGVPDLVHRVRELALPAMAAELVDRSITASLGFPADDTLLVRLGGSRRAVEAAVDAVAGETRAQQVPQTTWDALRRAEPAPVAVVRYSCRPSRFPGLWQLALHHARNAEVRMHATPMRGIVRVWASADVQRVLDAALGGWGAARIVERGVDLPPRPVPPSLVRIERGLRDAFDPHRRLNPGLRPDVQA